MGAKTWMLVGCNVDPKQVFSAKPVLNRVTSQKLARAVFPKHSLTEAADSNLSCTNPPDDEVCVGVFPGVSVIAASEFGVDRPSKIKKRYLRALQYRFIYLHAMHSAVDWFAFCVWEEGKLVRALSLSPDSGVIEDIGERMAFELPFWQGLHPVEGGDDIDKEYEDVEEGEDDKYPFVFHPLELGEAALENLFGYVLEGDQSLALYDAEDIPLMVFKRSQGNVK